MLTVELILHTCIFVVLIVISFFLEKLLRLSKLSTFFSQLLFKFVIYSTFGYIIYLTESPSLIKFETLIISSLIFLLHFKKDIKLLKNGVFESSFLFLTSIFILVSLFSSDYYELITIGIVIFILSDLISTISDIYSEKLKVKIIDTPKSVIGLFLVFLAILIILVLAPIGSLILNEYNFLLELNLLSALEFSLLITALYSISSKYVAPFIIPLIATILIYLLISPINSIDIFAFGIGIIIAGIIVLLSYKVKFLTLNGAIATFVLASLIFGLGGIKWSVPIMSFFLLSSILSKIRKNKNSKVELFFEKSGTRDYLQVAANGGLGGILVIISALQPSEIWYLVYIATLSAVCADTWATEIGTYNKRNTYSILNFKLAEQGVSGGISVVGTIGAILGAFVIALSGIFWIQFNVYYYLLIIVFAGVFGSFFDSYLGATVQAQYTCINCGKITERLTHCGSKTELNSGFEWLNNDFVNLFSGIAGGIICFLSLIFIIN